MAERYALTEAGRMVAYTHTLRESFDTLPAAERAYVLAELERIVHETKPARVAVPLLARLSA